MIIIICLCLYVLKVFFVVLIVRNPIFSEQILYITIFLNDHNYVFKTPDLEAKNGNSAIYVSCNFFFMQHIDIYRAMIYMFAVCSGRSKNRSY
jgi:hypothetical protein